MACKDETGFWDKILKDDKGNPSSMRIMSISALAVAAGLAFIPVFFKEAEVDHMLVLYFLTAAFAPKAVQKFAEKKP